MIHLVTGQRRRRVDCMLYPLFDKGGSTFDINFQRNVSIYGSWGKKDIGSVWLETDNKCVYPTYLLPKNQCVGFYME